MGRAMKQIRTLWKLAVEEPLQGLSGWLGRLVKAAHYHPEKAYMRCRADRGQDHPVSTGGEASTF